MPTRSTKFLKMEDLVEKLKTQCDDFELINELMLKYNDIGVVSRMLFNKKLEDGITLPDNVSLTVYKAKKDGAADPLSAALLYNGIKNKEKLKVTIINSELHVFTRLKGRNVITPEDIELQNKVFNEILTNL